MVTCATGPLPRGADRARSDHHASADAPAPLSWFSDGWHGYRSILVRVYRKPVRKGKRGRPAWVVPETLTLTQTVTHRHEHRRLLSVETRAALGPGVGPAGTVHVERLNGALRDRLNALTRKTHAFAKRNAHLRCACRLATLRSQLSSGLSGEARCLVGRACIAITADLRRWLWG